MAVVKASVAKASAVMLSFLLTYSSPPTMGAGRPDRVDTLYLCRSSTWQGERRDLTLSADPALDVLGIETVGAFKLWRGGIEPDQVNRRLRIYMPRNYEQLITERDLVILHDAPHSHPTEPDVRLDPRWIHWFRRGVEEEGLHLSMWGGDASWGGQGEQDNPSWGETELDSVLPFECLGGYNPSTAGSLEPVFTDPKDPMTRLPWASSPPIGVLNKVAPKTGARLRAVAVMGSRRYPWIAWWMQGKGRVLGEAQVFSSVGAGARMRLEWDWWQDFLIYLVYFAVGKPMPDDIYRAHRIREEINTFIAKSSLMVSLFEFIERFGVNTVDLYEELNVVHSKEKEAESYYLQDDYDSAAEVFDEVYRAWEDLNTKAMDVKEKALFWVYLIEWLLVTGAAAISGTALWGLMVGRRLYREVGVSRSR